LFILKDTLNAFDQGNDRKLVFIDKNSFYHYIGRYPLRAPTALAAQTVNDLLDVIEPYLPLALNEENFDLFLRAARETEGLPEALPDYFLEKARLDFLVSLYEADDPLRYGQICNTCEAMRTLWEEAALPLKVKCGSMDKVIRASESIPQCRGYALE
jgi:hypothetical protein